MHGNPVIIVLLALVIIAWPVFSLVIRSRRAQRRPDKRNLTPEVQPQRGLMGNRKARATLGIFLGALLLAGGLLWLAVGGRNAAEGFFPSFFGAAFIVIGLIQVVQTNRRN